MVTLTLPSQKEAVREIHDRVRQHFTRHKFATFGDALSWWHEAEYEDKKLEAAEQGMPKFSTDILWLISLFGPTEPVDHKVMDVRKVPALRAVAVVDEDEPENPPETAPRRRKVTPSRRRRYRF